MSAILFIKANDRPVNQAVSMMIYDAFLQSYKDTNPGDHVLELDLYGETLPYMNAAMIGGIYKSIGGLELNEEEKSAVAIADKYLDQFLAVEKVVFAFPLWNLTVPAVLHTYFDYLNRAGKTFRYTAEGQVGLVLNKKVVVLNARGSNYSEGINASSEMAVNFVLKNLQLFGITDITTIIVEGHNQQPARRDEIIQSGIERAIQVARAF